jgi:hypothetical protein
MAFDSRAEESKDEGHDVRRRSILNDVLKEKKKRDFLQYVNIK